MRPTVPLRGFLLLLFSLVFVLTGCIVTTGRPVCSPHQRVCDPYEVDPAAHFEGTIKHGGSVLIKPGGETTSTPPPESQLQPASVPAAASAALGKDHIMPTTVLATHRLGRTMRDICVLASKSAQFQIETGKSESLSLDEHCFWPRWEIISADQIVAPLLLHEISPDLDHVQERNRIGQMETQLQFAYVLDSGISDARDRWTDACNRVEKTLQEMLTLQATIGGPQIQNLIVAQPSEIHNEREWKFVDGVGAELQVEVFPVIVQMLV